jgi:serine/threonine protein kinase
LEAGDRFGEYTIIKPLAAGGMARVYLARKAGMAGFTRPVAMKVILPQYSSHKDFIEMFTDEARLVVCLNHSSIAQVIELGEVRGQYFIAMEFAHGQDLQQISRKTRKSGRLLPLPYAAKIVSQVAEGLYYAHTKADERGRPLGIVHRDISPHNVILTFDGIAKLIDFGIAKAKVHRKEEDEGVLKGKFSYMSPEQIRGMPIDPRSDIFALGIVLWEVCTGAALYREKSELLTMEAILRKPVPAPRELRGDMPPDLEAIIMKALTKRAVDRFQTGFEMHQALEGYLNRSGWNVGTPHLAEFMKKLFPDEYTEIRDLLAAERVKAESEERVAVAQASQQRSQEEFVAWVPYEQGASGDSLANLPLAPASRPASLPRQPSQPPAPAAGPRGASWTLVLVLLGLVLLLGAGAAFLLLVDRPAERPSAPAAAQQGSLRVESEPGDAELFINGKSVGRTPFEVKELPFDEDLTVRIEAPGYEIYYMPMRLGPARPSATVQARLKKK